MHDTCSLRRLRFFADSRSSKKCTWSSGFCSRIEKLMHVELTAMSPGSSVPPPTAQLAISTSVGARHWSRSTSSCTHTPGVRWGRGLGGSESRTAREHKRANSRGPVALHRAARLPGRAAARCGKWRRQRAGVRRARGAHRRHQELRAEAVEVPAAQPADDGLCRPQAGLVLGIGSQQPAKHATVLNPLRGQSRGGQVRPEPGAWAGRANARRMARCSGRRLKTRAAVSSGISSKQRKQTGSIE